MTFNGAIMQLVEMRKNSMMPVAFKPYFDKVIETLSEVEQAPQWIPCSEMLPENYERVLTTISIPNRESKVRSGYYHNGLFSNDNGDCWNSTDREVKGWCKLPEPYKPEEESE